MKLQNVSFSFAVIALNTLVVIAGLLVYRVGPFDVKPNLPSATIINDDYQAESRIAGTPVRLVVSSLGMDMDVKNGEFNYDSQEWTVDDFNAFYAQPTSKINNRRGHTLIYGHNKPTAFEKLHDLQPGSLIQIYTDNGYMFEYIYDEVVDVTPQDVDHFDYTGYPRVTLQTCSGNWSEYRRLFEFRLLKWEEA